MPDEGPAADESVGAVAVDETTPAAAASRTTTSATKADGYTVDTSPSDGVALGVFAAIIVVMLSCCLYFGVHGL